MLNDGAFGRPSGKVGGEQGESNCTDLGLGGSWEAGTLTILQTGALRNWEESGLGERIWRNQAGIQASGCPPKLMGLPSVSPSYFCLIPPSPRTPPSTYTLRLRACQGPGLPHSAL